MSVNQARYVDCLNYAYRHFNVELFGGNLPEVVITLIRKKKSLGYFHANQWRLSKDDSSMHQLNLSPNHFKGKSLKAIFQTLVHEMAHVWQEVYGKPSRNGYHNKEWAAKMHEIGLKPVSYDNPGKETGQKVGDEIKPDDRFERVCDALIKVKKWEAVPVYAPSQPKQKSKSTRTKYTCDGCGINAWGKAGLAISCQDCDLLMHEVD